MNYTENYNLKIPDGIDFFDIEHQNSNAQTIDTELKKTNNRFNDTVDVKIGTSPVTEKAEDGEVKISYEMPLLQDFFVVANNKNDNITGLDHYSNSFITTYDENIVVLKGEWDNKTYEAGLGLDLEQDNYIIKIIPISGTYEGELTVSLFYLNNESYFVKAAEVKLSNKINVFTQAAISNLVKVNIKSSSGAVNNNFAFIISISKVNEENETNAKLITTSTEESIITLESYEGKTSITTTSNPKLTLSAEFKSKFYYLSNKKIDEEKALNLISTKLDVDHIVESLNTTEEGYALGAKTGGEAIAALNDRLNSTNASLEKYTYTSTMNIIVVFGSSPTGGGTYFSSAFFVPTNGVYTLQSATLQNGTSTGAVSVSIGRSGLSLYATSTNSSVAGKSVILQGTISYS